MCHDSVKCRQGREADQEGLTRGVLVPVTQSASEQESAAENLDSNARAAAAQEQATG